ncbi:hypothetical protein QFZ82_000201 [Streptomyces sp. V4I23]|nr:hypothetical protein [Streptomyces sp. V4I23]
MCPWPAREPTPPRKSSAVLDLDATLVTCHSEKEKAAVNYKHGYGFHLLLCFLDNTGEALAGLLRPGNAGANTASDHITVLDAALAQTPMPIATAPTSSSAPTAQAAPKHS